MVIPTDNQTRSSTYRMVWWAIEDLNLLPPSMIRFFFQVIMKFHYNYNLINIVVNDNN